MQFTGFSSTVSPTVATFTQPAPGAGRTNVVTGISGSHVSTVGAITAATFVLRDGASGVGTVIYLLPSRTAAANEQWLFGIEFAKPIFMTPNTQTTLEFTSIIAAGASQIINIKGYII